MRYSTQRPAGSAQDDLRQLPKWVRRYAQNRTLPTLVFLVIIALSVTALAPLVYLVERAYRAGDLTRAVLFIILSAGVFASLLWFRFVIGARVSRRIGERLYRGEGDVSMRPADPAHAAHEAASLPHFLLLFCVLAWYGMLLIGIIAPGQMLPTSALFMVPFLVYFYAVRFRHKVSPFMLLWPTLYAVHAGLLALGAPIYFHGGPGNLYEGINMVVPAVGYGLIAALAGHLYSRLALRRLRALGAIPESSDGE